MKYIFLGIIQGITEFLPISSSGHLLIFKHWFNVEGDNLILNIFLHLGTLLAIFVFFRHDIKNLFKSRPLCKNIIITTIVTAVIAILFRNLFEKIFTMTKAAGIGLIVTAIFLLSTFRFMGGSKNIDNLNIIDAVLVGLFQAIAIIPGISRSGLTISVQLWRRVERQNAFRYSFLVSIPAILGALVMELPRFEGISDINFFVLAAGFLSAFFTGLISLRMLLLVIKKAGFSFFGYYCMAMAFMALFLC